MGEPQTLRGLSAEPGGCQARIQGSRSHSPPRQAGAERRKGRSLRAEVKEDGGGVTGGGPAEGAWRAALVRREEADIL